MYYCWFFWFVLVVVRAQNINNFIEENSTDIYKTDEINEGITPTDLEIVSTILNKIQDQQCQKDLYATVEGLQEREEWALRMFDATAKFPVGLLDGAYYQLGDFDECINVKPKDSQASIQGKYCLIDIDLTDAKSRVERSSENFKTRFRYEYNNTIHWGICLPSSCSSDDIKTVINTFIRKRTQFKNFVVNVEPNKCHIDQVEPITTLEIVYGVFIGLILLFTILATAFHYNIIQKRKNSSPINVEEAREKNKPSILTEYIICFSIIRNVSKFLHVSPSDSNLECICGIKLISMCFIIVGHSLIFIVGGPVLNPDYYVQGQRSILAGPFINNPLLVDTFLLISGFLLCFLLYKELEKRQGKVNFLILYIARYIRLTPAYIVILGFYCSWFFRLGNGPLWDSRIGLERDRCLTSWWANLLYINNYVATDNICMFQSWYLAVDYHLFIIAPIVIYPLWKWQRMGKTLLGGIILVAVLIPFMVTYYYNLDPTLMTYAPEIKDLATNYYFIVAYIKTHMRASSYFIGILFGFFVNELQSKGVKIPKRYFFTGWFVSSIFGLLSMYSVVTFYLPEHEYNAIEAAIYGAFHRIAWCIFIGWVLLVCITDHSELVNKFLSWKPFVPLSRLTYCAYLVNGLVVLYSLGTARVVVYMSYYELFLKTVAHLMLTFTLAFILCIICESPIHGIEKILLRRERNERAQKNNIEEVLEEN